MSNKQETIADIVAAMRNEGHTGDASCLEWVGAKIRGYADRIEAAHQREVAVKRCGGRVDFREQKVSFKLEV